MKSFTKNLLIVIGSISVVLGIIGIFLPLLPTTPFLLLGASCYIKSSKGLYNWLINNKLLGDYIKNYHEGNGIPLKAKILSISMLWITIGWSAIIIISNILIRIILILIAISVTTHILLIRTLEKKRSVENEMVIETDVKNLE